MPHAFFAPLSHSRILRRGAAASAALFALTWSVASFGGEIHDAARNNDLARARALLKANPGLVFSKDDSFFGYTPLHWAAKMGHKEMAELLLVNRAEVDARDSYGLTPLHWAA